MSLVFSPNKKIRAPLSPTRDFEIFVKRIPLSVPEQELISMFEKYGDIYKMRLVTQGNGFKNYAFIRFKEKRAVREAVLRWNGYQIRKGHRIYVSKSVENKNLVLCSLPRNLSSKDIYYRVLMYTTGLQAVDVHPPRFGKGSNSGIALLRFETHTSASIAKKVLYAVRNRLWNHPVYIEWHTPGLLTDEDCAPSAVEGVGAGHVELYSERRAETGSNFWAASSYHDLASETVFFTEISNIAMRYEDKFYWNYGNTSSYASNENYCNF